MTKNFNSNNLSSNNKNNKKKNIKNDSINNADKIMEELYTELNSEEMGMEQFQKVLEQIADHSLPESEKLPLVQKLNQEHAKEDNCLEDVIKSNQTSKTKLKNLQRKTTNKLNNLINDNKLDNNQIDCETQSPPKESHLQKLENYCDQFVNNNSITTSLTNSLLNNCNHNNQLNRLDNNDQIMSNEMYLQNSSFNNKSSIESSQKLINKECDNLKCEHKKNRLLFNVSNTNENYENYEFKDYSRQAQLVEYTSALKYADLKENNDLDEHKLEPLIKNKDLKSTTANHYDQSNQLKYNLVNTQYAEKILDELKDSNRNYSSDCLNRYQTNLIDNQSHAKLSSSTSDGYISSMNTYFDNDNKSSNFQLNSNYSKKGSTSIQTNGKSENNHLKKKKKPEKKLTQHCQGYVGYLDVNFLTNYITGNKTTDMRNQVNSTNNTKEMNIKKKDKFNNLNNNNKQNKKNGQSTTVKELDNDLNQSNDKNNNLTIATNSSSTLDTTIINSTNIIPNSSINQLNDNSRINSIDKITNENNQNMNNQTKQNSKSDKKIDNKKYTSSNQSRKSSAASNLELNNSNQKLINQRSKDDKSNSDNAKTASSIVSNGNVDPMYIVSDSEVPDQEGDFKIVKYKNLRRKKQKKNHDEIKLTNQQNKEIIKQKKFNNQNKPNPATARGYESESDYCAVEGRKRESNLKRDILIDDKKQQQQHNHNNKNSISDSGSSINSQQTNEENNQQNELLINTKAATKLPQQQTNFTATFTNQPQFTNPNIPYSKISTNSNKISYAAITKMNYSNNNTALQITTANNINNSNNNTTNLINNNDHNLTQQLTTQTNQETNKKEIINKKINNKNDNKSNKSIFNTNEQNNNKKTDDKKSNDKEPKKIIHLDNSNSNNYESKELNFNNLSDDNSRTITATSIDYQFTSDSSNKTSNSFNTPPVIMLDEKNSNQDTQFTFGFFDENDKLSASNLEDESIDDFKTINIDSVNFISNNKEPSNNSINNSSFSYQSNTSLNEVNNVLSSSNKNLDSSTTDNINSTSSSPSPLSINTTNNESTILSTSSDTTSTTNNNNSTQFCQGTYIMNCDNNEDSSSLRDNITKHVNTNEFNKSSGTLANEITSFNLTKFIKEKIPSPIIPEVNHNQFNLNQQKYHQPDFKKSVAYIKTVNYIRKAWEETMLNKDAVYI